MRGKCATNAIQTILLAKPSEMAIKLASLSEKLFSLSETVKNGQSSNLILTIIPLIGER